MNKFIHLIADYGVGDPSFNEVSQKLIILDPEVRVNHTSVPAFSTLATGFWMAQYASVNPIPGMLIYSNTAPRKDKKEIRTHNEGEDLVYAKLKNGIEIVGVNSGFCFSFVKPEIAEFKVINVANKGSQFRSRDFFPEAVIGILHKDQNFLGSAISAEIIPMVPKNRICWIDGYGNLKTSIRLSEIKFQTGNTVVISLNGIKRIAYFTDGTFSVPEGNLAFAPGSSGGGDRFMEIFLRGLSAWYEFGKPKIEEEFTII